MLLLFLSSGGVGFDINCGVRLLRTNLMEKDVQPVKEQLTQSLFDHIPVGVGSKGIIPMNARDLVTVKMILQLSTKGHIPVKESSKIY